MVVRIRITRPPPVSEVAPALAGILSLISVSCFALAAWKILFDVGWAGPFFVSSGLFSHWQIWLAGTVGAQLLSFRLSRQPPLIS
jgi:hypothetical protein